MNSKKSRLGKGLDALLGDIAQARPDQTLNYSQSDKVNQTKSEDGDIQLKSVAIDLLDRGQYQPRTHMDEQSLNELADSIKSQGLIQPILVRKNQSTGYEILAGHRRWQASIRAGLKTVPVIVKQMNDASALAVALIENIQREDLNPIEQATGLKRLMDEFGLTHQQIATNIGRSRSAVTNLLRLLSLSENVKDLLEIGKIEMGHARALLSLNEAQQNHLAHRIIANSLNVRDTESLVKQMLNTKPNEYKPGPQYNADIARLEDDLSNNLAAKVSIVHGNKKGKLIIEYHNLDELDGIIAKIIR